MHLKKILKNKWYAGGLLAFFSVMLSLILSTMNVFENLELKSLDSRFNFRGPLEIGKSDIVIVAIDDQSFASLRIQWPFPRRYFARVVNNLAQAGARLIVLDIEFTESAVNPIEDTLLAASIENAGNVILAGKIAVEYGTHDILNSYLIRPIRPLLESSRSWGLANVGLDPDGFIRRYNLFQKLGQGTYFPLGVEALKVLEKISSDKIQTETRGKFVVGQRVILKYNFDSMLINYRGPARSFDTYSFANVLDDAEFDLPEDEDTDIFESHLEWGTFRDKIVFIGASAGELQDNKFTPFFDFEGKKRKMPGVEVHANALSTMLNGDFIVPLNRSGELFIMLFLSLLAMIIAKSLKPFKGLFVLLAVLLAVIFVTFLLFVQFQLWAQLVSPCLTILISYGVNLIHQVLAEQKEKGRYRKTFQHYVARSVVDTMLNSGELPRFGGERKRLTVLFSDIRSFTTFTEKHPPEIVVQRLTEYLSTMVDCIFKHEGTLDKFVGDEIMAIYGAPYYFENHAERACKTALDMVTQLRGIQRRWSENHLDYFQIGIGINTGKVIVGNLGSIQLFDYTVIGDEVNLGARLEGANKQYYTTIIISESTYNEVKGKVVVRELDYVRVKGKSQPVKIYELRGMGSIPDIEQDLIINVYSKGLRYYKERKWYQALKEFRRVLRYFPSDGPSRVYIRRCLDYIENPPSQDWDGVYDFDVK